jgi:hypothetical protein
VSARSDPTSRDLPLVLNVAQFARERGHLAEVRTGTTGAGHIVGRADRPLDLTGDGETVLMTAQSGRRFLPAS